MLITMGLPGAGKTTVCFRAANELKKKQDARTMVFDLDFFAAAEMMAGEVTKFCEQDMDPLKKLYVFIVAPNVTQKHMKRWTDLADKLRLRPFRVHFGAECSDICVSISGVSYRGFRNDIGSSMDSMLWMARKFDEETKGMAEAKVVTALCSPTADADCAKAVGEMVGIARIPRRILCLKSAPGKTPKMLSDRVLIDQQNTFLLYVEQRLVELVEKVVEGARIRWRPVDEVSRELIALIEGS